MKPITLTPGKPLSPPDVASVARGEARLEVGPQSHRAISACRASLERRLASGHTHYGINTGFGSLSTQRIPDSDLATLQRNLIRSHASGVGEPLPTEVVRGMMTVLAASLARGHSGVRAMVVEQIVAMLNAGIAPVVPESGSVGASGDLAPLAHVALCMIGEGEAVVEGQRMPAGEALRKAGIDPLT
ncbi:MAG: aromatic amino acid lyase, partial [Planctomycetota bacterium]